MGEILIKGKPFAFQELEITYENATTIDKSIAKRNLLDFKKILDQHHITFLIMHGTLLGAIREHEFIKHDIDIDTCTMNEEGLVDIIPSLSEVGLKLCRYEKNVIYSFIRDNVYIDVYIVNELEGLIKPFYVRYLYRVIPKKYFKNHRTIEFQGEYFKIPNHALKLLEFWYGKNWRTPIDNFPSNDEDKVGRFLWKHMRILFKPIGKKS